MESLRIFRGNLRKFSCNPKDPAVLKILRRMNSLSEEISCEFSPGKQGVSETPS